MLYAVDNAKQYYSSMQSQDPLVDCTRCGSPLDGPTSTLSLHTVASYRDQVVSLSSKYRTYEVKRKSLLTFLTIQRLFSWALTFQFFVLASNIILVSMADSSAFQLLRNCSLSSRMVSGNTSAIGFLPVSCSDFCFILDFYIGWFLHLQLDLFWLVVVLLFQILVWHVYTSLTAWAASDCDTIWLSFRDELINTGYDVVLDMSRSCSGLCSSTINNFWVFADACFSAGGLILAISGFKSGHYIDLQRSIRMVAITWPRVFGDNFDWSNYLGFSFAKKMARNIQPYLPTISLLAGYAGIAAAAAYSAYNATIRSKPRRRNQETMVPQVTRIVPSADQIRREQPRNEPIDPDWVPHTFARQFPGNPTFPSTAKTLTGLLHIGGAYRATAFRAGNNLLTAVHCLCKHDGKFGAWVYNPDDKLYYFAPLVAAFKKHDCLLPEDGIAILDIPHATYFIGLPALSVDSHPTESGKCMVFHYTVDNSTAGGTWFPSVGEYDIPANKKVINTKASIGRGSSGGPVISRNGVMGVIHAESTVTNQALLITSEIVAFLKSGGAAAISSPAVASAMLVDQSYEPHCDRSCLQSLDSKTLFGVDHLALWNLFDGLLAQPSTRLENCPNTSGQSENVVSPQTLQRMTTQTEDVITFVEKIVEMRRKSKNERRESPDEVPQDNDNGWRSKAPVIIR